MKLTEQTLIKKVFEGIDNNGWSLHNGMGTGHWNGDATQKSMDRTINQREG